MSNNCRNFIKVFIKVNQLLLKVGSAKMRAQENGQFYYLARNPGKNLDQLYFSLSLGLSIILFSLKRLTEDESLKTLKAAFTRRPTSALSASDNSPSLFTNSEITFHFFKPSALTNL